MISAPCNELGNFIAAFIFWERCVELVLIVFKMLGRILQWNYNFCFNHQTLLRNYEERISLLYSPRFLHIAFFLVPGILKFIPSFIVPFLFRELPLIIILGMSSGNKFSSFSSFEIFSSLLLSYLFTVLIVIPPSTNPPKKLAKYLYFIYG